MSGAADRQIDKMEGDKNDMVSITWKGTRKADSPELLREVEHKYGIRYPHAYELIVMEYNAGIPDCSDFAAAGLGERVFGRLISVNREDHPNILDAALWQNDRTSEIKRIPFALDPFGNMICFRYGENGSCAVVFIDHETGREFYLADTFEKFLDMLYAG